MLQSPIKLEKAKSLLLADACDLLTISYPSDGVYHGRFVSDKAHGNFELTEPGPFVTYKGSKYMLLRVHIHEGSEHVIEADVPRQYEVHFVHVMDLNGAGATALDPKLLLALPKVVIGVLYREDTPIKTKGGLEQFSKGLPTRELLKTYSHDRPSSTFRITPDHFFPLVDGKPDFKNWFHYAGSLTSFPYTEDVSWFVMSNEASVNANEASDLKDHADQDARDLQPLGGRIVVRSFS